MLPAKLKALLQDQKAIPALMRKSILCKYPTNVARTTFGSKFSPAKSLYGIFSHDLHQQSASSKLTIDPDVEKSLLLLLNKAESWESSTVRISKN